jgi:hypothetical protein
MKEKLTPVKTVTLKKKKRNNKGEITTEIKNKLKRITNIARIKNKRSTLSEREEE